MNLTQLTIRGLSADEITSTLAMSLPHGSALADLNAEVGPLLDAIAHGERVELNRERLRQLVPPSVEVQLSQADLGEHATRFMGAQAITLSEVRGPKVFVRLRGSQNMFTVSFGSPTPASSIGLHVTAAAGDPKLAVLWRAEGAEIIGDGSLE